MNQLCIFTITTEEDSYNNAMAKIVIQGTQLEDNREKRIDKI